LPAETSDGTRITLLGNIEFPTEIQHCLERGAEGIGLYRTEFLYLDARRPPTEEEHYEAYSHVVRAMQGRPVVSRTLDLGADQVARVADYVQLRTNDRIQYTLAVDRNNQSVANLFSAADPAVLRLIRMVVRASNRHGIPLSVCGEMSAQPIYTLLLVGLGITSM